MTPKRTIDLNADVGEARDAAGVEVERTLMELVTSVNVACGGHAGDDASMDRVLARAGRQHAKFRIEASRTDRVSGRFSSMHHPQLQ